MINISLIVYIIYWGQYSNHKICIYHSHKDRQTKFCKKYFMWHPYKKYTLSNSNQFGIGYFHQIKVNIFICDSKDESPYWVVRQSDVQS